MVADSRSADIQAGPRPEDIRQRASVSSEDHTTGGKRNVDATVKSAIPKMTPSRLRRSSFASWAPRFWLDDDESHE
jgi:hypothetical protein